MSMAWSLNTSVLMNNLRAFCFGHLTRILVILNDHHLGQIDGFCTQSSSIFDFKHTFKNVEVNE